MFAYQAITRGKGAPDGSNYCISLDMVETGIFYNKTFFAQHGLRPPENWGELITLCQRIQKLGKTPLLTNLDALSDWGTDLIFDQFYHELMPGLDYRLIELPGYGLKVHAWSFDQDKFAFRMAMEKTPRGSHVRDLIGAAPDVLAINGGFFERDRDGVLTPSGLVIMRGQETSHETSGGGSGIVYWGAAGVGIGYRKELPGHGIMAEAVRLWHDNSEII